MKYPSVFLSILVIWISVILLAVLLDDSDMTFRLYLTGVLLSLILFVIGFWRNK